MFLVRWLWAALKIIGICLFWMTFWPFWLVWVFIDLAS